MTIAQHGTASPFVLSFLKTRWRGVALSALVGCAGIALGRLEEHFIGREWLEGLVLAIILGLVARLLWTPSPDEKAGIAFCAKPLLEVAIVLLGASLDAALLQSGGVALLASVVALVVLSVGLGTFIGRAFGLPAPLAVLVACGNSICGNSAIAAIAPVIEANEEDIASAVAFTALGSVAVVVALPFLGHALGLSPRGFGALAGLSVYAVPQVLATTAGAGVVATQTATLVKLARVLMLGPLTLFFARSKTGCDSPNTPPFAVHSLRDMIPPFIVGFALLGLGRSLGLISPAVALHARDIAGFLTVIAMAALGLSSDPRTVQKAGRPVLLAASLSLFVLVALGCLVVRGLRL